MATNLVKFPKDLGDTDEHQHFLVFRIYSNSSASLGGGTKMGTINSKPAGNSRESRLIRMLDSGRGGDVKYSGAARKDTGDDAIMKEMEARQSMEEEMRRQGDSEKEISEALKDFSSQQGEVIAGGLKAFFSDTTYSRAKVLNQDSIFLPFPQAIAMSDGWNWETVSFQKSAVGEMIKGDVGEGVEKALTDVIGGVGTMTGSENVGKLVEHSKRRVSNPRKESMFNEPEMRKYSFEFDFAPRDAEESENLNSIIQLMKYHSSPELFNGDNALYNYPSEYQIYFVSHGKENKYIAKIDRCAMTSIAVNYTNAGMWSAFHGDGEGVGKGAPTHVKVSIELTELSLQSRNSLQILDGAKKKNQQGKE